MSENSQIDPSDFDSQGGNFWDHARREYLAGVKATLICQRYGMSLSSFRLHARVGRWRRMDRTDCDAPPEPGEYHPDDIVSFADLAEEAFLNIRRALGAGRASEASTWMRLYEKLADRARAEVMADLPDVAPPERECQSEPLMLCSIEESNAHSLRELDDVAAVAREQLDSLDPVFSESDPAAPPDAGSP